MAPLSVKSRESSFKFFSLFLILLKGMPVSQFFLGLPFLPLYKEFFLDNFCDGFIDLRVISEEIKFKVCLSPIGVFYLKF